MIGSRCCMKKLFILTALLLSGCNSQPSPSKNFTNTRLLFDLDKEVEGYVCPIRGEIPSWLSGTLLRNGPAKFQVGDKRVDWFDGLAMLHAFTFTPQEVLYANRFLRSEQYYIMTVEKSLNFSGFAQDPCPKVFKNQTSRFIPEEMRHIQNADVSIQEYADKMVALTEAPLPVVFDPETLATMGVFTYQDELSQGQWESAHPQHDLADQESVNYFIRFGEKSSYVVWKMKDGESSREIIAEIPVERPAYMHSFALTEHYVILAEFPFVVNPLDLMQSKKPFIFNYKWQPERGTVFLVIERSTGNVTKIKGEPFFAFHHVNAFDKEGKIYMDIVTHPNADVMNVISYDGKKEKNGKSEKTKLERFTITMDSKIISRQTLFSESIEMPRVPAEKTAHEYRYAYVVDYSFPNSLKDSRPLYKVDTLSKSAKSWSEEGCFPGEPIFVSRPGSQEEDDGVVLSLVLDFARQQSFLLILDAKEMEELARAEAPHAIPIGLHGSFRSASD